MRPCLLLALTACWTSPAPKPVPFVYDIPPRVEPPPEPPIPCGAFVETDPACEAACPRDAPDDWRGCDKLAAQLQSQGYACTNLHPRTCRPPPPRPVTCPPGGCVPVTGRVVGLTVNNNTVTITVGAGSSKGVTASWRARVVDLDAAGTVTVIPGGDVTILRVNDAVTVGTTQLTRDQMMAQARYVLFEP